MRSMRECPYFSVYSLEKEVSELRVEAASLKGETEKYNWVRENVLVNVYLD